MRHSHELWIMTILAAYCSLAASAAESTSLRIVRGEKQVSILGGEKPLRLEYRYTGVPYKPYVEKLFSPSGVNILRDSPHDHRHHHGLMLGLTVDGVDFWGEFPQEKPGSQVGRDIRLADEEAIGDVSCVAFTQQIDWLTTGKEALLYEQRTIEAYQEKDLEATLVTWKSHLQPASGRQSVTITGTHYDGLGMRFVESMDGVGQFQYACDEPGPIVRGTERITKTKWCAYTAPVDGKTVTVALFDHPDNWRHPAGMFTMLKHFAYISATPNVWQEPLVLKAGESTTLRYGIALWDGKVDKPTIERLYQKWLKLHEQNQKQDITAAAKKQPNVLLICVDDLRPQLGCYGCEQMITPSLDRLASEGRMFTRHYVQVAACGPSRCSMLTGQRILGSWDCWGDARTLPKEPDVPVSFPYLFRRGGYRTVSIGKVSHEPGGTMPPQYEVHQVPFSWDLALGPTGPWKDPWRAFFFPFPINPMR